MVTIKDIFKAKEVIKEKVYKTPIITNEELNKRTGNTIFLKLENFQKTNSFKIRGVINKIFNLSEEEKNKGLICASSGNHGLGVGYISSELGLKAYIVIPEITPIEKIKKLEKFASVIIKGRNYLESFDYALKKAKEDNLTFLHPFDDPFIIAGQGTVSLEVLEDIKDIDLIIVPIGGGGLASGTLIVVKSLMPKVKVIGVQSKMADSMYKSWKLGKICEIRQVNTIVEGIAVGRPGEITFEIINKFIDDIVIVDDNEILEGMKVLFEDVKVLAELAGVVSVSSILTEKVKIKNKKISCIITGGNFSKKYLWNILKK